MVGFITSGQQPAGNARIGVLLAGAVIAAAVGWTSEPGKQLLTLTRRDAIAETKKVVWPSRKETVQTTGVVVAVRHRHGAVPVGCRRDPGMGGEGLRGLGKRVMSKKWYVVHAYSGFEKSVARALKERIERDGMQEQFGQILVPVEEVVEMKSGQKSISERKFFPGYVLVEMEMTDDTWHLVKNTAKVTGFVGGTAMKPTPISEKEVQGILHQIQEGVEKPKPKVLFEVGEAVRVKEGPFTDFHGSVEEVNYDKNKIRVSVSIFGRVDTGGAGFQSGGEGVEA